MFPKHFSPIRIQSKSKRSSALVITLAALVLISAIILVFFDQSTLNRQISFSSAGQYRADLLAHTALDTITGDIRNEIVAGSTSYTSNSITIYIPTNNFAAVPCHVLDQSFPNLVKQSAATSNFWTGAYYNSSVVDPVRSAPNNSTQTSSANGRYIKINQWNKPGLLGDPGSGTTPSIPESYTTPPDWILITRAGAVTNAPSLPAVAPGPGTLSDKSSGNSNYVVGRYAYAIYDEGGLLDVNVAGYPSSVSGTDFTSRRGLLPQVDLANIPGIDSDVNANALVQWRNQATATSATSYTNYVFAATNGFTTVALGDQAFVSRKDLIHYAEANSSQVSTSALQYLGTFSRQINAPSYSPSTSRPKVKSAYLAYGQDDSFNPSLVNTRVSKSFVRDSDNTTAVVGEPLLKYRFPLSRLGLVTDSATSNSSSPIYKYFGLTRSSSSSPWTYNHGSASAILTLSQVAQAGREPDFFELLQAAISIGSLGQGFKRNEIANNYAFDTALYSQIIQIGANLIDQYDTDSYPVQIVFNANTFSGVENLPYIACVFTTDYNDAPKQYSSWYQPEIWNPYASPAAGNSVGPTQFRFITTGTAHTTFKSSATNPPQTVIVSANNAFLNPTGITFSTSATQTFSTPTILTQANASALGSDKFGTTSLGIWIGSAQLPSGSVIPTSATKVENVTHVLQYQRNGGWITYSSVKNIADGGVANDSTGFINHSDSTESTEVFDIRPDPRTDRFGVLFGYFQPPTTLTANQTIRPDAGNGRLCYTGALLADSTDAPWSVSGSISYFGDLSENLASSTFHYRDPDGQQRRADGAYVDGAVADGGYPLAQDSLNNPSSRPVVLNRPFRSVAEMGYAFRDEPWKHLDFFTSESPDAALLDLFCLNEAPALPSTSSSTDPVPLAGALDLNSRQTPVLRAVLTGIIKADEANSTVSYADATALASNLVALTQTQPLLNRSELVTRWISSTSIATCLATTADATIKRRREAAIRALSDVGNTRTWNLLIDVIAQSGRYPSIATNLNNFIVEEERRYWLHVAIDRYTGKVVAQFLEPIDE